MLFRVKFIDGKPIHVIQTCGNYVGNINNYKDCSGRQINTSVIEASGLYDAINKAEKMLPKVKEYRISFDEDGEVIHVRKLDNSDERIFTENQNIFSVMATDAIVAIKDAKVRYKEV